jgi:NAD(P)-dependent dehydrogenase (short-subunit alcohol dehydrogenase family)
MSTSQRQSGRTGNSLAGKVAVITGASRGIGAATALLLAAEGARVALVARDLARLEANAAAIVSSGGQALALPCDVSDESSVIALFDGVRATYGAPDILVNAAGTVARVDFAEMPAEVWDTVLGVNLRGTFLCCRQAFRHMIPHGGGVIVNFSSLAGVPEIEKFPGNSAYTVSKFGVAGLSEALAVEGRPHGIRVIAISPGAVDTEMRRQAAPHLTPGMTADEMARILLFLVGPDAGPLGGTNLVIHSNL